MLWDGDCGFCRYWVIRWQSITGNIIDYRPYQEAAADFPDIDRELFREASRLIDLDGRVFSGPSSAYRSVYLAGKYRFLHQWYLSDGAFRWLSDQAYEFIAQRRNLMFRLTKALFGSNPRDVKPFWVIYLAVIFYLLYSI